MHKIYKRQFTEETENGIEETKLAKKVLNIFKLKASRIQDDEFRFVDFIKSLLEKASNDIPDERDRIKEIIAFMEEETIQP